MKKYIFLLFLFLLLPAAASGDEPDVWQIVTEDGHLLTEICVQPTKGDEYIAADNGRYLIVSIANGSAIAAHQGAVTLPSLDWVNPEVAWPVMSRTKRIGIYCTHSDESYESSDGYYSTNQRGTIYQVAQALATALEDNGISAKADPALHHPHDAGAYRRSRQTAVSLLKSMQPDCLIDVHRDGIPDPSSYAVSIGGNDVSKIRLLVGRGNQNAEANKEFAMTIKAVADRVYPGLIKDIYMGKGTFNQDLLPRSILFECGTYTVEKERVVASMEMIADVLDRALYGGLVGSAGHIISDSRDAPPNDRITMGEEDPVPTDQGHGSGFVFLGVILVAVILGLALLSAGSMRGGFRKASRHMSEMTGGLIGRKPEKGEDPEKS